MTKQKQLTGRALGGKNSNNRNTKRKGIPIWFFIDRRLQKRLKVDRSNDLLLTWDFTYNKRVVYTLSSVRVKIKPCYSTKQAAQMLNRYNFTLLRYVESGDLRAPAMAIMPDQVRQQTTRWRWSEEDIMEARDFLATKTAVGDTYSLLEDRLPAKEVPSRQQLRALMNNEQVIYVQNPDGSFVPTWLAKDF